MTQDFEAAYEIGEHNEGGYANIPGDKGGLTYRGIAENSHPDWAGFPLIKAWVAANGMPERGHIFTDILKLDDLVKDFYRTEMWPKMRGDEILSRIFALYFYDWFINSQAKAVMRLQEILSVQQTGHLGDITLAKVNDAGDDLLTRIHARRIQFYHDHVALVPEDKKFLAGWLERSQNLYEQLIAA